MITIIDYGMGNLGSVANMIKKIGAQSKISSDLDEIRKAEKIILPGVGAFDAAVKRIDELGLREVIVEYAMKDKKPLLGICLGMQLLMDGSEEGILPGLGLIRGNAMHFKDRINQDLKIPHMGWNVVRVENPSMLTEGFTDEMRFYFVHSYFVKTTDPADSMLKCSYGIEFDAGVHHENVYGAQFHPEKSHKFGMKFFEDFAKL